MKLDARIEAAIGNAIALGQGPLRKQGVAIFRRVASIPRAPHDRRRDTS